MGIAIILKILIYNVSSTLWTRTNMRLADSFLTRYEGMSGMRGPSSWYEGFHHGMRDAWSWYEGLLIMVRS